MNISQLDISNLTLSKTRRSFDYSKLNELELKQRYGADILLTKIYQDITNKIDEFSYRYDDFGAPYFDRLDHIEISISHSNEYVIIGVSKHNIGIDIEYLNKTFDYSKIINKCFNDNEINNIKSYLDFYDIWTKKEAYLKYLKDFKTISLKSFNVFDFKDKFIKIKTIDNYIINIFSSFENKYELIEVKV